MRPGKPGYLDHWPSMAANQLQWFHQRARQHFFTNLFTDRTVRWSGYQAHVMASRFNISLPEDVVEDFIVPHFPLPPGFKREFRKLQEDNVVAMFGVRRWRTAGLLKASKKSLQNYFRREEKRRARKTLQRWIIERFRRRAVRSGP